MPSEYFIPEVGIVQVGSSFRLPTGRQINAGWLAGASAEDLAAIGALPVNRQAKPDFDPRTHRLVEAQDGPNITYAVEARSQPEVAAAVDRAAADAGAAIDQVAEQTRLNFVTAGSAQAMVYRAKNVEVDRWVAAGEPANPGAIDYPWAADRAQRIGGTVAAVLADWKAKIEGWQQIGIAIENIREGAKDAVADAAAAEDFAAIETARNAALADFAAILQPQE